MDRTKDKVGYEVPFTRLFYKFIEPRKSEDVFADFEKLAKKESVLTKVILGEKLTDEEQKLYKEIMGE